MTGGSGRVERRLAAIFAADVAGYSRLMSQDEVGTLRTLTVHRAAMDRLIGEHGGRIANTAGDSVLAEFPSSVDAVQCAVEIQKALAELTADVAPDRALRFRIGVHVGDVMVRGADLLGDGVNIAARLEGLAEPGGVCVSGAAYEYVRKVLPLSLRDLGLQQIKNIEEPVQAFSWAPSQTTTSAPTQPKALPLPDKPSIAVLPFTNMSGDPEQEYFADGIVEDIITALSRVRWFFVIARNSSFTYKGRAVDIRQVGRELGVRYVLEGSIRRASSRIRITGQLIEAATGRHVWADRFDGDVGDIFDLQDRITEAVVGAIEPSLRAAEVERARSKPTDNLDAYDLYLKALPHFYGMSRDGFTEAVALCDKARVLDPSFALAKALASFARAVRLSYYTGDPGEHELAVQLAREVVRSGTDDPQALGRAAHVLGYIGRAYEEALGAITLSLELNQNSATSHGSAGWIKLYVDEPVLAEDHFRRAHRLSPVDPEKAISTAGLAVSFAMRGQRDLALEYARRAVREMPQYPTGNKALIHALVMSGLEEEARAAARRFLQMSPTFTLTHQRTVTPFRNQAYCTEYLDALKRAGIPE